jgi:hypothetical protein
MNAVPQAPSTTGAAAAAVPAAKAGGSSTLNKAELRKKKIKIAMVSGMLSFTFTVIFSSIMGWTAGTIFPTMVYLSAAGIGGIAAAIGYLVTSE